MIHPLLDLLYRQIPQRTNSSSFQKYVSLKEGLNLLYATHMIICREHLPKTVLMCRKRVAESFLLSCIFPVDFFTSAVDLFVNMTTQLVLSPPTTIFMNFHQNSTLQIHYAHIYTRTHCDVSFTFVFNEIGGPAAMQSRLKD